LILNQESEVHGSHQKFPESTFRSAVRSSFGFADRVLRALKLIF